MSKNTKARVQSPLEQKPNLGLRIAAARVIEYTAKDYVPEPLPKGFVQVQLGFKVECVFGIAQDLKSVVISPSISGFLNNDPEQRLCFLRTEHLFNVDKMESYLNEDQTIELPKPFMATVIGTALGMARGILFAKNFGMSYAGVVVPMMDLTDLIPKQPFSLADEPIPMLIKAY